MPCVLLSVSGRPGTALTAVTSVVSSGLVLAAVATGCGPIALSEPGASPCGSWPHAGPKTSALVLTPVSAAAAAGVAGAAAGAPAAGLDAGAVVPPQAARARVAAAITPTPASRWSLRTGGSSRC